MSDATPVKYSPKDLSTTGRTSRRVDLLPVELRQRYLETLNDPDYLSSRENIQSMEMRVQELYKRAYEPNPMDRRGYNNIAYKLKKLRYGVRAALDEMAQIENDAELLENYSRLVEDMLATIEEMRVYASHEDRTCAAWDEIRRFELTMGKLKDTDVKRMVAANQCLTVPESYNLVQRLVNIIETYLEDKELRARAIRELHLLLERKGTR